MIGSQSFLFRRPVDFGKWLPSLGQICQFNGRHHLPLHANRDKSGCAALRAVKNNASRSCATSAIVQEKFSGNTNWRLFAQICAEERGDLCEVFRPKSGLSDFFSRGNLSGKHSQRAWVKHSGQR